MVKDMEVNLSTTYDDLYSSWYMNDWPQWKKDRLLSILKTLSLPETGRALDYGCGSGVFTRWLKEVLPGWEVVGTDISEVGMKQAAQISSGVAYCSNDQLQAHSFQLIFSHHVLEHVDDITKVAAEFDKYASAGAYMFHVMPCGNEGSLDHYIARNTKNGINPQKGNTFFYEEPLHLNRFRSSQLEKLFSTSNWTLQASYFANHHLGCLSEMTGMNTQDIRKVTEATNATSKNAKLSFQLIRTFALAMYYLQRPYTYLKLKNKSKAWTGPLLRHPELRETGFSKTELMMLPSYLFVKLRDVMESIDWQFFKKKKNGSEMYLIFKR
jgi:SAM-dependent methyltransferase